MTSEATRTTNTTSADWVATRAAKWRAQASGMEAMIAQLDAPLLDALQLDEPVRVAEVGSGGGATAFAIARRAPAGSTVDGFDIAPPLVELAQSRMAERAPDGRSVTFRVADMATAGPPGEPYSRLASRFGVMFFEDAPSAFANLRRWLVPGGRFAFAGWGPLAENPWMTTAREEVTAVISVPPLDPKGPNPFRYADVATFIRLLETAGFADVAAGDFRGLLPIGGGLPAAEAATFALASFSTFQELLEAAGPEALEEARRRLTARYAPHEDGGVVRMGTRVHIVTGVRPVA
jgi:SAM-dependent methyltransferase